MSALKGLRVIDLTRILAGPFCTMILGDMGAEVLKIEHPSKGDDSREFGPFINGISTYYLSINRNKRSITLDLKNQRGQEILKELIKSADVLVENFRPGTMEKLGLGYNTLKEINPKLIYASCSGFGQTGPYSKKPAYDLIVQGLGGMMSITGHPGGIPTKAGSSIGDIVAGLFTAIGILGALNNRNVTGMGQKIDVGMLDCQVAILENAITRYFAGMEDPGLIGNRHPSITPFASFETQDDFIIIAIGNDSLWKEFCDVINRNDLIGNPKFESNKLRTENYQELHEILTAEFKKKARSQWLSILDEHGIPCAPINKISNVIMDPHVIAREMIVELDHPGVGKFKMAGSPIKLSGTPIVFNKVAPSLGEDTKDVLQVILNYSDEDIEEIKIAGAI